MEVEYSVQLHKQVISKDLPSITKSWRRKIKDAVDKKLVTDPVTFSYPLKQNLKGCRKLRVGDYRIVFTIEGKTIYVIAILHRSKVYKLIKNRVNI